MIHSIKLADQRTIIEYNDENGELVERGGDFFKLTRGIEDVWALWLLLKEHEDTLQAAYEHAKKHAS